MGPPLRRFIFNTIQIQIQRYGHTLDECYSDWVRSITVVLSGRWVNMEVTRMSLDDESDMDITSESLGSVELENGDGRSKASNRAGVL